MYNSNTIWNNFWHLEDKSPILNKNHPEYKLLYGGTNYEPDASIGISCFLQPVIDKFKNNFKILDIGCGAGIVLNYISLRLDDFYYVGLEPPSDHGKERINIAKKLLNDKRGQFDFITKEKLQSLYNDKFDCIILISVFTHLTIEDIYLTLDMLLPFLKNTDTKIIFSCFVDNKYSLIHPQPSINNDFYGVVKITEEQILDYTKKNNLNIVKVCDFVAAGNHVHNIYSLGAKHE